jgi:1,6-anhydro-N-acetylmuramate kinase
VKATFRTDEHGEPVFGLTIDGPHDILRFANNMLDDQVEFGREGRKALAQLRDWMRPDRFDAWAPTLLGRERFDLLTKHGYFEHPSEEV